MGMTIDESVSLAMTAMAMMLSPVDNEPVSDLYKALGILIDTARKYQMYQLDYESRLKADLAAMLTELQLEIREHDPGCGWEGYADKNVIDCIIQQKINELETKNEGKNE